MESKDIITWKLSEAHTSQYSKIKNIKMESPVRGIKSVLMQHCLGIQVSHVTLENISASNTHSIYNSG